MHSLAQFRPDTSAPAASAWWLVLVLFVTALNAPLRRRAAKEAGRGRGGVLVVVVLLAWFSDPLLRALDVSAPNWRIAAGLTLIVGAIVDLFTTPVAPLVLRPEVGVLAVAAGADHGVWPTALAALIGLLSFTFMRNENRPLGRGFALVQIACATLLLLDGVFAV